MPSSRMQIGPTLLLHDAEGDMHLDGTKESGFTELDWSTTFFKRLVIAFIASLLGETLNILRSRCFYTAFPFIMSHPQVISNLVRCK